MVAAWDDLTTFFHEQAATKKVVGSALAIFQGQQCVYQSTYGFANLETRQPVEDHSIFHWASITKTITGIAVMQLRDQGLLTLDDPLIEYLPELGQVHNRFGDMDAITIRHILTHSGGFRKPTWTWGGNQPWHPYEPYRWEQIVAMFPYTEILFTPGSTWSYSNLGIIFLGQIIERVTDEAYTSYVEKNILRPLKMRCSYFDRAPAFLLKNLVRSYYLEDDGYYAEGRYNLHTGITTSNGGFNAPLEDMVKYGLFLLGNAEEECYRQILKRSSLEEMFEPHRPIPKEADMPLNIEDQQMGLSFFIHDSRDMRLIGHAGSQNGFISHLYVSPGKGIGYVVAYNTMGETRELDLELKHYLLRHIFLEP